MKRTLLLLLLISFTAAAASAQSAEKEAVLKACKAETYAYLNGDKATWLSYRIKSKDASATFVNSSGYFYAKGWDSISKNLSPLQKQTPKPDYKVNITNPVIRVNGDLAWAEYSQVISLTVKDSTNDNPSTEMRVFNKENGKWKILTQITTNTATATSNTDADVENGLNTTGYKLLSANNVTDAIEVFKLNVKLHPNAWNPYDSLGEAFALAGNNDLAKENYEMSLKLNPKNDNAAKFLKKLADK